MLWVQLSISEDSTQSRWRIMEISTGNIVAKFALPATLGLMHIYQEKSIKFWTKGSIWSRFICRYNASTMIAQCKILTILLLIGLGLGLPVVSAQESSITVSGTVTDSETGELIVGAALYVAAQDAGVISNQYGYYSLTLQGDSVSMVVSHVAYTPQVLIYSLQADLVLDISMVPATLNLEELEVTATVESALQTTQMSAVSIPVKDVENLPTILGESDVLRIIQLLPGIQSGVEGSTGLYVRGGGPDQNLYLLDGTQVYNPSHLFGFLGTFNSDAIKDVRVLKGGFPARYGGRLSSVIDLTMKEGNMKRFAGTGSIGFLASRLTLEGPIKQDRASFLISARRSYADLLMRPFLSENENFGYYFSDLNLKTNAVINKNNRIYLSGYWGEDRLHSEYTYSVGDEDKEQLSWSNLTATARWNHIFGPRLFSNVLVGYTNYALNVDSEYQYDTGDGKYRYEDSYESGIRDLHARLDVEFIPSSSHSVRFGAGAQHHSFLTGAYEEISLINNVIDDSTASPSRRSSGREFQAYVEDDWRLSSRIRLNTGIHASSFLIDDRTYVSIEPRVSGLFRLNSNTSMKASLAYMQQYIHLLATTSGLSLPTDLWVPATAKIQPQRSWQVAGGVVRSLSAGKFELSLEGYYKRMDNLIEYKDGADYFDTIYGTWEDRVVSGIGAAYGGELFFQKKSGRTTGWIGYTLSWSRRKFDEINHGRWFPYRYDRRHDAALVVSYKLSPRLDISGTWIYGTGQAVTLPVGYLITEPHLWYSFARERQGAATYQVQSSRNGARLPDYHRLDIGLRMHRTLKRVKRTLSVGTYNTYSRKNAISIIADQDEYGDIVFKKFSILPILPSISYQLSF